MKNHVLLMDEVDGMAGNEDRGGLQELIALIKTTSIPIICVCNNRDLQKMRTLSNYTFDLKFSKPRIEQIKVESWTDISLARNEIHHQFYLSLQSAMKSICFKENIDISDDNLNRLIESTNQDIRQVINHLAMLSAQSSVVPSNTEKKEVNKDLKLGVFDAARKVLSFAEHKNMSIHERSNLFFYDYDLLPLFVQENYLSVSPNGPKTDILEKVALSAESLAMGNIIESKIRKDGAWSLLPVQACFSSVIPGYQMSGSLANVNFPSWLGKNSRSNKFKR